MKKKKVKKKRILTNQIINFIKMKKQMILKNFKKKLLQTVIIKT